MEMNAGGTVTVRAYEVRTKDGAFVVTPSAERTTVRGEPRRISPEPLVVKDEPAAAKPAQTAPKAAPASERTLVKASEKETKVRRRGATPPMSSGSMWRSTALTPLSPFMCRRT